jgi:hypothetical protein
MKPSLLVAGAFILSVLACKQESEQPKAAGAAPSAVSSAAQAPAPTASAADTLAPVARDVASVGSVPAFAEARQLAGACEPKDRARLERLRRGEDDAVTAGTASVDQLVSGVFGGCEAARTDLAKALNEGGLQHHKSKRYGEATRWWTTALRVDPSHIRARYNLACALALSGKREDSLWALSELSRAAGAGNGQAAEQLQKARTDSDLESLHALPRFAKIVAATSASDAGTAGLSGPRKDPTLSAGAVKLLPREFHEVYASDIKQNVKYKPALVDVRTWIPEAGTEILVATLIDDLGRIGRGLNDINNHYAGIAAFRRKDGKLTLLYAKKIGDELPTVTLGKGGTVAYSSELECGITRGSLAWAGGHLSVKHEDCVDRTIANRDPSTPVLPFDLNDRDFGALLKAIGLSRKNGVVLNACGLDGEASYEALYLGPTLNPAFSIIVTGADSGSVMPCYGQAGGASVLRRLPASNPDQPATFEVVLSVLAASLRAGTTRHLNTSDLILGASGFCEGHWRWNGKKYEHYKNEGPSCALLEDTSKDTPVPRPDAGTPRAADKPEADGAKPKSDGADKPKKGDKKPADKKKPSEKKKAG